MQIFNRVNIQVHSNTKAIKPIPRFNIFQRMRLSRNTSAALKELDKSYPKEKLRVKTNLLSQFGLLYANLRSAHSLTDEPMMHRYLNNDLYQRWRDKGKTTLTFSPLVYNIILRQAQLVENEHGKWIQCMVHFKLKAVEGSILGSFHRDYIMERKLKMLPTYAKTWYFVDF
jgi:hypothetical protein